MSQDSDIEKQLLGKTISNKPMLNRSRLIGITVIICFIIVFGLWAGLAPLESAAIAPGKVVVAGSRRLIQHLEGGIVQAIYVKDGSLVKRGEKLVQLDSTRPAISLRLAEHDFFHLAFTQARLQDEVNSKNAFIFPNYLKQYQNNQEAQTAFKNQVRIFDANQKALTSRIEILQQRKSQLREQKKGEQAKLESLHEQNKLVKEELSEVKKLYDKRLIERSRYMNLMREKSRLAGSVGETIAKIASIDQKIGETEQQIISTHDTNRKELLTELKETKSKLSDAEGTEKAARDLFKRTIIRSPQPGTVVDMQVHTLGQVIKPGQTLMEIVPKHEQLVIDAEISPRDIDVVHSGLIAKVTMSALQTRTTPTLIGKVTHVSADILEDEKTGEPYYKATVEISAKELKKLGKQKLYPGMPVEVMIITAKLTPWGYFVSPINRSFNRAFREQ